MSIVKLNSITNVDMMIMVIKLKEKDMHVIMGGEF